ncbi:hypothetical protein LJC33_03930 [Eubacteriales bacterium OttesenSCG-928-N13]|nr:hypothetical protein [Eubacteriales bacterium OttesenSCG-928-N13]
MGSIDKRGVLEGEIFSYRAGKDDTLFIHWQGRLVTALRGEKGCALHIALREADPLQAQLLMAKATGNFKRGNERLAKRKN